MVRKRSEDSYSAQDVFDYDSILDKTRPTKDIMDDIRAAQASIDPPGEQITDILNTIEDRAIPLPKKLL